LIGTVIINPKKQDREKVSSTLSNHGEIKVLAQGKDAYDALKLIGNLKPDIAILDTNIEFIDGEEIPPLIKSRSPKTGVIILIAKISDYQLFRAASNRVSGFVHKETDLDKLGEIVKTIHNGGCFISPAIAARVLGLLAANRSMSEAELRTNGNEAGSFALDPTKYLSKTELRILTCIGEGYASGEIAKKLNLAVGTVRNYISSIMRKVGLNSRSQMVRYSLQYGLVSLHSQQRS